MVRLGVVLTQGEQFALRSFAKSFAYFAVRTERQSKTAKVAKPDAKFRKENALGFQTDPLPPVACDWHFKAKMVGLDVP
jgi:hypothetical protein